ncbi:MAG: 50S ribosomal protein L10 [Ruminococcus sp.]|nr:50S ribosomal protein L10 [Ruminococcus sp.]
MASEKVLEGKKAKVAALTEQLQSSVSFVLVDYKGISVEDDTKLRKNMREAGVTYTVEKNSMLRFAFQNMGIDAFDEVLHGTTAVAMSTDDQTAPARILGEFADGHNDFFNLKAGYVEGVAYDAAGVARLSKIPSKEVLLAQLVGSLQGPIQKLAATLQAVVDSKSEGGDAPEEEPAA